MNKTVDERLFEQLMRAPHSLRRSMREAGGEGRGKHCRGRHGHHDFDGEGMQKERCHGMKACHEGHPGPGGMHLGHPVTKGHFGHGGHGCEGTKGHGMHGGPRMRAFAQERLLRIIQEKEGGIRQKELVEELKVNPSSVSEIISKLQAEGYVERTVDPMDKRATLITLTELGRARAYELEDERNERFSSLFSRLTDSEKEQLVELLEKLTAPDPEEEE